MILSNIFEKTTARRLADVEDDLEAIPLSVVRIGNVRVARRVGIEIPKKAHLGFARSARCQSQEVASVGEVHGDHVVEVIEVLRRDSSRTPADVDAAAFCGCLGPTVRRFPEVPVPCPGAVDHDSVGEPLGFEELAHGRFRGGRPADVP